MEFSATIIKKTLLFTQPSHTRERGEGILARLVAEACTSSEVLDSLAEHEVGKRRGGDTECEDASAID